MSIIFDLYGNVIPKVVKFKPKLTDFDKDIIKEVVKKFDIDIEKENRTFYCKKHKCFHKAMRGSKKNQTYVKCLQSGNIEKFLDDFSTSEQFKMSFKNNWNQDKADYYKNNKKKQIKVDIPKKIQECLKSDYCKAYESKDYEKDDYRCEMSFECNDFIDKNENLDLLLKKQAIEFNKQQSI